MGLCWPGGGAVWCRVAVWPCGRVVASLPRHTHSVLVSEVRLVLQPHASVLESSQGVLSLPGIGCGSCEREQSGTTSVATLVMGLSQTMS